MQQTSLAGMPERIARIEGTVEQMSLRLGRTSEEIDGVRQQVENLRRDLNGKVDKWEVRIWFLLLLGVNTVQFGLLSLWLSRLS